MFTLFKVGVGVKVPTHKLHVKDTTDPVKIEGVQSDTSSSTKLLVLDSDNVIKHGTVRNLSDAGVSGAANQLLTDDGDGTVTSESELTFGSDILELGGDDSTSITIQRKTHGDSSGGQLVFRAGDGTGTNKDGGNLRFHGGRGTGSGDSGEIRFSVSSSVSSGTTQHTDPFTRILTLTSASATITGNIVVSGTVDGRDVATDGSKLDGIEAGATADQTQSDINGLAITTVGTIDTGVWNGTAIASAYLDSDTAHLSGTQTFSGTKTFSNTISGSIDGNAATATALETARTIGGVSFNGTANINLPGVNLTGSEDTTGNAATATALESAINIGGVSFDGTSSINLPGVNTSGTQDTSGNAATATSATSAGTAKNVAGNTDDDVTITSDGEVIVKLDSDNDESNQKFKITKNSDATVFHVQEDGNVFLAGTVITNSSSDNDLTLETDGSLTFTIDRDNDETSQKFSFVNYNTEIANLDESGNLNFHAGGVNNGTITATRRLFLQHGSTYDVSIGDATNTDVLQVQGSDQKITVNGTIELGHASDTTIARSAAGKVSIEGDDIQTQGEKIGQYFQIKIKDLNSYMFYMYNDDYWYSAGSGTLAILGLSTAPADISSANSEYQSRTACYTAIAACTVKKLQLTFYWSSSVVNAADIDFAFSKFTPITDGTAASITMNAITATDHNGSYTENKPYQKTFTFSGGNASLSAGDALGFHMRTTGGSSAQRVFVYGTAILSVELD